MTARWSLDFYRGIAQWAHAAANGLAVAALLLAMLLMLPGCGGGGGGGSDSGAAIPGGSAGGGGTPGLDPLPEPDGQAMPGPTAGEQREGVSYDVTLTGFDGETIAFTVHEPETLVGGESYPLLLFGHGFGASRQNAMARDTPGSDQAGASIVGFPLAFLQAGYGEISIDQRGFGDSTGAVRVLDPEVEGRYLIQVLDWAQANLDWIAYRDNNMLLGARGGSYGGGYQLLINNIDPRRRLDAIIPQITWYDLNYSLNPNNVPKSGYSSALSALSSTGGSFLDDEFSTGLVNALVNNALDESLQQELSYHSNRYFCEGLNQPGRSVPPTAPPAVDALFLQGSFDVLFNLNEAVANYQCLEAAGGDVRLFTYGLGHVLPSGLSIASSLPTEPDFNLLRCGDLDEFELSINWFNAKLKQDPEAIAFVESLPEHCLVTDVVGTGIKLDSLTIGGTATPAFQTTVPQGVTAPITGVPINLYTASADGEVVAGIPTADISISPTLATGDAAGDAIIYLTLARSRAGLPGNLEPIDDQILPLRGLGDFSIQLAGIAETLNSGDSIQLIISGASAPQFTGIVSRDASNPFVDVAGQVNLPLLGTVEITP